MATKLGKPVTREVTVKDTDGCEGVISVTITADGITVRGKGTQRELSISYGDLTEIAEAPERMPAKFEWNKMGWLINRHHHTDDDLKVTIPVSPPVPTTGINEPTPVIPKVPTPGPVPVVPTPPSPQNPVPVAPAKPLIPAPVPVPGVATPSHPVIPATGKPTPQVPLP
jgi:hypothetical protein